MVEAGHLHIVAEVGNAVRQRGGTDQMEIRGIGQHRALQQRVVRGLAAEAEPDLLERRSLGRMQFVARVHRAELERAAPGQPALRFFRQLRQFIRRQRRGRLDVLRGRHFGHAELVFEARLGDLEGNRAVEDGLAMLDGQHAARGKAVAVAQPFDLIHDRRFDIAGAQEIAVQRVRDARAIHSLLRRRQRLAQHLAAEHEARANITALAAEQVVFEPLQAQQRGQFIGQGLGHGVVGREGMRKYSRAIALSRRCSAPRATVFAPARRLRVRRAGACRGPMPGRARRHRPPAAPPHARAAAAPRCPARRG